MDDSSQEDLVWAFRLLALEAWSGKWIECSECGHVLIRLPGESDYHCPCGVTL